MLGLDDRTLATAPGKFAQERVQAPQLSLLSAAPPEKFGSKGRIRIRNPPGRRSPPRGSRNLSKPTILPAAVLPAVLLSSFGAGGPRAFVTLSRRLHICMTRKI